MLSGHPWNQLLLLTIDRQNPCQAQKPAVHPGSTHTHTHCTLTHTRNGQGRGLTTTVKRAKKVNTDGNQSRKDWTHQGFGSSGSGCSEALHLAVPLQASTLTSHSCTESQSQDKWYCCLPSSLLERREEWGREGGREMTLGNPALGNLWFSHLLPYRAASLDSWTPRSSKAHRHSQQVEATWRNPPYQKKNMSPTLGESGFSGSSQERWQ